MTKMIELNGETHFLNTIHDFIELLPHDSQKPVYDLMEEETGGKDLKTEFRALEGSLDDQRKAVNEVLNLLNKMEKHMEGARLNRKTLTECISSAKQVINNTF
ncbi:hypothetical protein P4493_04850 [Bacillus thuringiensis]|jgi:hypothetical protein|uniref:Uncharacterized protein n=3 Tax=Bacillus thuringiensis TaxID=1428 RepID=A0A0B5NLD2_BACTU|nr:MULTISPECIES: hypothetical protein [Bacillus]MEC2534361.1 hypothetical protein [Bacillus cereus]MED1153678.1 hypothetical protein [Bacillus paranthracis]OUB09445.1 hypothetical protein BK708_33545 [Bacillus thuringiensis serovar yunnanensis]AFQ29999.1 hypothetical protein BTF1_29492 [Bacillus thuringiensis HD-789]AJG74162.1 hypothetical protein BF38_5793 [Bacillus thuringiensis]